MLVRVCDGSWASGSNPWGPERDDQFMRPTHYDGMLEVVGVTGVVHMGQIGSGLRTGMRIAQGGHVSHRRCIIPFYYEHGLLELSNSCINSHFCTLNN